MLILQRRFRRTRLGGQWLSLVKDENAKALKVYDEICEDFTKLESLKPNEFVNNIWEKYQAKSSQDNSINGKVFEYILSSVFINNRILPFYMQAKVAFVPNADYDLLLYCKEKGPISISVKTSLRERYKQADLEAVALKYVYRKSENYLITLNEREAEIVRNKIKNGDLIGIDEVIYAKDNQFNDFINRLKANKLEKAGSVEIIKASVVIE